MTACVGPIADIAIEDGRGRYARIAAVRAVATAGTREDLDAVWGIVADQHPVDRHLAAEIVRNASSDRASIDRVLALIERLTPYERFQTSGLSDAFHRFLDGFDVQQVDDQQELARLIEALNEILSREAVHCTINRSHGGGIEKRNSTSKVTNARKSNEHRLGNMTWLVAAKLAMIRSPLSQKAKSSTARKKALVEYFVAHGFEKTLVEDGIDACQHDLTV